MPRITVEDLSTATIEKLAAQHYERGKTFEQTRAFMDRLAARNDARKLAANANDDDAGATVDTDTASTVDAGATVDAGPTVDADATVDAGATVEVAGSADTVVLDS